MERTEVSMHWLMDKRKCVYAHTHTHKHGMLLDLNKDEILSSAAICIEFEVIMLNGISQAQKENRTWFHSYVVSKK